MLDELLDEKASESAIWHLTPLSRCVEAAIVEIPLCIPGRKPNEYVVHAAGILVISCLRWLPCPNAEEINPRAPSVYLLQLEFVLRKLLRRRLPRTACLALVATLRHILTAIAASRRLAALQPYSSIAPDNNERPAVLIQSRLYNLIWPARVASP